MCSLSLDTALHIGGGVFLRGWRVVRRPRRFAPPKAVRSLRSLPRSILVCDQIDLVDRIDCFCSLQSLVFSLIMAWKAGLGLFWRSKRSGWLVRPRMGQLLSQESASVTPQKVTRRMTSLCFKNNRKILS